jgi:hypothetical protein
VALGQGQSAGQHGCEMALVQKPKRVALSGKRRGGTGGGGGNNR